MGRSPTGAAGGLSRWGDLLAPPEPTASDGVFPSGVAREEPCECSAPREPVTRASVAPRRNAPPRASAGSRRVQAAASRSSPSGVHDAAYFATASKARWSCRRSSSRPCSARSCCMTRSRSDPRCCWFMPVGVQSMCRKTRRSAAEADDPAPSAAPTRGLEHGVSAQMAQGCGRAEAGPCRGRPADLA
jgi:hypothetical protein